MHSYVKEVFTQYTHLITYKEKQYIFRNVGHSRVSSTMEKDFLFKTAVLLFQTYSVRFFSWLIKKKCHFGIWGKNFIFRFAHKFSITNKFIFFQSFCQNAADKSSIWHFGEVHLNLYASQQVHSFPFILFHFSTIAPLSQ